MVFAGPGAGKSHVVGELARNLIRKHGLWPDEILVISFSRAAIRVVRERTQDLSEEGSSVTVSTLDALAAEILRATDPYTEFRGYDQAIQLARDSLLRDDTSGLDDFRHIIIDEVQDVVGVRAEFAFEVLASAVRNEAGFTLLGDQYQSLYDFQVTQTHSWSCDAFLTKIDESFAPDNVELSGDFRSKTQDAGRISELRPELEVLDDDRRLQRIRAVSADLPPLGHLDAEAVHTLAAWTGTTAFLCDTNARVGIVVERLAQAGLTSVQLPKALDSPIPSWVGKALEEAEGSRVTREWFLTRAENLVSDPEASWRRLLTISGSDRLLDIERLAARITPRAFEHQQRRSNALVVSTVHRAKGLEFENVVLVDPNDWRTDEEDPSRATRMLYVALSRARSRVTSVTGCPIPGWFKVRLAGDRQIWLHGPRGRRGGINGLLLEPAFTRPIGPSKRLDEAMTGRELTWSRTTDVHDVAGEPVPTWVASVYGVPVAQTGEDLGHLLSARGRGKLPDLSGGRIEGFETTVQPDGHASSGKVRLGLGVRIAGVVDLKWR